MKSLTAKANAIAKVPKKKQYNNQDITNNTDRVLNVSKTTNNDATIDQKVVKDANTHNSDIAISLFNFHSCIDNLDDVDGNPWLFRSKNIKNYQSFFQSLVSKHELLSLESYVN